MSSSGRMSRRAFLHRSAAGAAALAGLGLPARMSLGASRRSRQCQAVVIVRFGGGVRFSEMWTRSGMRNIPFLCRLAREGAFFPRMYNRGRIDHAAGTCHILTGTYGWPEPDIRPQWPTLFEYARNDLHWPAEEAIVVSHLWDAAFATFSTHPDYGARFGATRISPEMVEMERLEGQLRAAGLDRNQRSGLEARLQYFRAREERAHDQGDKPLPGEQSAHVRKFVRYLSQATSPADFQPFGDDQAAWFAMEAIDKPAPRALLLPLGSTDRAVTGRWSDYVKAIRRCDWLTGKLYAALQGRDRYREGALFVVVPDHGRCGDGYGLAGFQDCEGADEACKRISCVLVGPGIRPGVVVDRPCEQIDILPTIAELMGFDAPLATGKPLKEALQ